MAVLVQLLGQIGTGKSFLARKLAQKKKGVVVPFAKDVYRLARLVKGAEINKALPEDRELLKTIGTTWGRESREVSPEIQQKLDKHKPKEWGSPDIWANILVSYCRNLPRTTSIFNDDTRFLNELEIAIRELNFMPVFVLCRDETRLERIRKRGEVFDANLSEHASEEVAKFLSRRVLNQYLLPVVWTDTKSSKPKANWFYPRRDFERLVLESRTNEGLASRLQWNSKKARSLMAFLHKALTNSDVSVYA